MTHIEVYTDGACSPNPGKGGWGYVIVDRGNSIYEDSGFEENTTNQRMELKAVIEAYKKIDWLNEQSFFCVNNYYTIYTDSAYVANCFAQNWYKGWRKNGWANSKKEPVANQDLWKELLKYHDMYEYDIKKVKGHQGVEWNEYVDKLAVAGRSKEC